MDSIEPRNAPTAQQTLSACCTAVACSTAVS